MQIANTTPQWIKELRERLEREKKETAIRKEAERTARWFARLPDGGDYD